MNEAKPELLRGTLDMLILKIVALGPSHGYAIAQRLRQVSKDFFTVHQGSLYPALRRLLDRVKEEVRDTRWETHLETLARDFRYALRNLRKDRRFSLIAIFALALGIGASTIVFSVVYNVFFHPLPYKDFDRSAVFEVRNTANVAARKGRAYFSPEEFRAFREQNHVFDDMIAHGAVGRLFYDDGKSTRVLPSGAAVSTNTFDYLGVPPLLG